MFEIIEKPSLFENSIMKDAESLVRKDRPNVSRRIFLYKGDRCALVESELKRIEDETGEMYSTVKEKEVIEKNKSFGGVITYRHCCERNARPTGRYADLAKNEEVALSSITRANACNAYVSHQFVNWKNTEICIQRIFAEHTGHDPKNPSEFLKSRLSPDLVKMIHHWLNLGYKPKQVHDRCESWARNQGHLDQRNRRFYPTVLDIRTLAKHYKRKQMKIDLDKAGGLSGVCETAYKKNIIYFQQYEENENIPLLMIVQSPWQLEQLKKFGSGVAILNATFNGVSTYGYSLYTLLVRNDKWRPVPVAFCFMSEESEELIYEFLSKVRTTAAEREYNWQPVAVMVDTDWKEIHALNRLFNQEIPILLCWFRMLQVVLRWTVKDDSGLRFDREERQAVVKCLSMLKDCSTEDEFEVLWQELIPKLPKKVVIYLTDTWKPIAPMWANYGRLLFRNFSEANLAIEQLFCTVKWQFFKQYINRPIDDLLQVLMVEILNRSTNVSLLVEPGKLTKPDIARQNEEMEKAKGMLTRGDANRIVWHSENNSQTVPSETMSGVSYIANVSEMWCSCQHNQHGVKCKHLCLVELCCLTQGTDVDRIRESIANRIFLSGDYQLVDNIFTVVNSGTGFVNCVDLTWDKCICPAASFAVECVCRKVVRLYKEAEHAGVGGLGASYPITVNTPPVDSVYEEEVVDDSHVVIDDGGAMVEIAVSSSTTGVGVPWTTAASDEMPEGVHADDLLSGVEMAQFSGAGEADGVENPVTSEEARLMCENILAKINTGWKPDDKVIKNLRKLGGGAAAAASSESSPGSSVSTPGVSKGRIIKVKRHVASVSLPTRSSKK